MRKRKILVLVTFALALLAISALAIYSNVYLSRSLVFDKKGTIVLGEDGAEIELVLFEDFQCSHCQHFSEEILPQIQSHYIDPGIVRCTIVPVPLFSGSKALTNVALTVFEDTPDALLVSFKRTAKFFPKTKVTDEALLSFVEQVGGFDVEKVEHCIQERCHYADIDKNFKRVRAVMGKNVLVPTLYINGVAVSAQSFQVISVEIEKVLSNEKT